MDDRALTSVMLSAITFDEGLYPRIGGHDPETVQSYARDIEQIESAGKYISINADGVLLDGRHRMLAYKKLADGQDREITVYRYAIKSPMESFRLACELQDRGRALTTVDRIAGAKRLYGLGEQSQAEIAKALGVSQATVSNWLSRTLKEEKERNRDKAFALWLACETQEAIAVAVGVTHQAIAQWIKDFAKISDVDNFAKSDFTPPIYNIWKRQTKSNDVGHFGNSEPTWLENLIYLYTAPGDIVVDPFAGSGSTIDVCKKHGRRYFVSDRKPIVEREHEIRMHDLIGDDGSIQLPAVPRWKDVGLVYLDPPYWKQAAGRYSNSPNDLANMDIERFNDALSGIINAFRKKINGIRTGYIALIIQPTQWKTNEDRDFIDHVGDMLRIIKLPVNMRYSVPYESQQCTAQMVEWAKENKRCLVLTREIIVWSVAS